MKGGILDYSYCVSDASHSQHTIAFRKLRYNSILIVTTYYLYTNNKNGIHFSFQLQDYCDVYLIDLPMRQ